MKRLFLVWKDYKSQLWYRIGHLSFDGQLYKFKYCKEVTKAQEEANFQLLMAFPELDKTYESKDLFAPFSNRVINSSRPEYLDYLKQLNLPLTYDPLIILARTGGQRVTDYLEVFPYPELEVDNNYHIYFLARDVPFSIDIQPSDEKDILSIVNYNLHTSKYGTVGCIPPYIIDYLPSINMAPLYVTIERINPPPSPAQFRILCKLTINTVNAQL